jgi:hypothetical protein
MAASILEVDKLRTFWHHQRKHDDGLPLSELLERTVTREATRPVDRLFSILAMKSDPPQGVMNFSADYTRGAPHLDRLATQYIVTQEKSLNLYVTKGWSRYDEFSWAVQFTQSPIRAESPLEACKGFLGDRAPAACTKANCEPAFDGNRLTLGWGSELDQIGAVLQTSDIMLAEKALDRSNRIAELAARFYAMAEQQIKENGELIKQESSLFADWKAPDWNTGLRVRPFRGIHKLRGWFTGDNHGGNRSSDPPPEFRQYATHCLRTPGRSFFVTRRGFIGVAYPPNDSEAFYVQPGHSVVVIDGAKMPFILSPSGESGSRRIICAAFLSCLMDNELHGKPWERVKYVVE